uniref:GFA family protein n=1 Tax=Yoonia sp. GPGPB17 TaxID=3026147 RepID=UPI0030ED84E8
MDCRKHHSAVFFAAAIVDSTNVTVTGETHHHKGRHFCPNCGSSVFAKSEDEIELHLGTLAASNQFVPAYEI